MKNLYLSNKCEVLKDSDDVLFYAYDDNNKEYKVYISFDDVANYLGVSIDIINRSNIEENIIDIAQDIYNEYELQVEAIKVPHYEFSKMNGRTLESYTVPVAAFANEQVANNFMYQNRFSNKTIVNI